MSNNISFVGRLGNDPELKEVAGTNVLEFSIANNVGFGEKKSTNWFRATVWGKQAVSLEKFLEKGKEIFVTGELTIRKYEVDGVEKFSNDIRVNAIDFVSSGSNNDSNESEDETPF